MKQNVGPSESDLMVNFVRTFGARTYPTSDLKTWRMRVLRGLKAPLPSSPRRLRSSGDRNDVGLAEEAGIRETRYLLLLTPTTRLPMYDFTYRSMPSLDGSDHRGLHLWPNASIAELSCVLSMSSLSWSRSSSPVHRMMGVAGEQVHPFSLKKELDESRDLF